ncbi:MAG: LysR family transcriptional regulator [Cohaesibacter sp.]|nr:LysR family transcriptional regulator [Cohaesibacter sp.]
MKLSINQLRALEAVARTGSFSSAAKELGISQPSVSNHLSALEKHFRTQLINRNGRKAEPTELCQQVLSRTRSVLAMTDEIEQILDGCRQLQSGTLRLGYSTYQFAMPILSAFMEAYPDIQIEARAMASHDLIPLLQDGNFDVIFVTARSEPPSMVARHIRTEKVVAVVPPAHPFAQKTEISWQELATYPLVQREKSSETRQAFEAAAQKAGVSLKTVLALGSWGSIVTSVHNGIGVGIAMAGEVTPSDGLIPVPIKGDHLSVDHYLVCLPEMQHVATIKAMFDTQLLQSS